MEYQPATTCMVPVPCAELQPSHKALVPGPVHMNHHPKPELSWEEQSLVRIQCPALNAAAPPRGGGTSKNRDINHPGYGLALPAKKTLRGDTKGAIKSGDRQELERL